MYISNNLPQRQINNNQKSKGLNFKSFHKVLTRDVLEIKGKETCAKVFTNNINFQTFEQIKKICSHPVFRDLPVRIMPDTHAGKSAVVGFTAPVGVNGEIIPSLLGNDLGCGMLCVKFIPEGEQLDFKKLDSVIREYVCQEKTDNINNFILKKNFLSQLKQTCDKLNYADFETQISRLGTLGGGNHFIEIDKNITGEYFLLIHTGSRNLGKQIAQKYEHLAKTQNPYNIKDLSYLSGAEAKLYLEDVKVAQEYAKNNRKMIVDEILQKMGWKEVESFESIHNYVGDDNIIRKGAISAHQGEKLLIPLNMRDGAIIAIGKGNSDWNNSAPHGAGRILSRGEAKKMIKLEDYRKTMENIYTTCVDEKTIDESPFAYKDSLEIESLISETSNMIDKIKPVYNFKNQE